MMLLIATAEESAARNARPDDGRSGRPVTETKQLNVAIRPDLKAWLVQHCRARDLRMTDFINDLLAAAQKRG